MITHDIETVRASSSSWLQQIFFVPNGPPDTLQLKFLRGKFFFKAECLIKNRLSAVSIYIFKKSCTFPDGVRTVRPSTKFYSLTALKQRFKAVNEENYWNQIKGSILSTVRTGIQPIKNIWTKLHHCLLYTQRSPSHLSVSLIQWWRTGRSLYVKERWISKTLISSLVK